MEKTNRKEIDLNRYKEIKTTQVNQKGKKKGKKL